MGLQLGEKAVAKAVKCAKNTVQYWLNWWKKSKNLNDVKHSERPPATTTDVSQSLKTATVLLQQAIYKIF